MEKKTKNVRRKSKSLATGKPGAPSPVVVAIGASAGGLEAVTLLLRSLPFDTGMAFIYLQHLSPDHKSILTSLLSKATAMKVLEVKDKMLIERNQFYIAPPNKKMVVVDGHIQLTPRLNQPNKLPIDTFFSSIAEVHKEGSIGIILSGSANDGTLGLTAIKQAGGLTFAQNDSAKFGSMPNSAIAAGVVDYVLSPKAIAGEITRISKVGNSPGHVRHKGKGDEIENGNPNLNRILKLINDESGVDFFQYKMSTIKRRILRRMLLSKIKSLSAYEKLLIDNNEEVTTLFQDLLIHVTGFFRDTIANQYLKANLFPKMLKKKNPGDTLRIWVPACSTGEEVYSLAMMLLEIQTGKANNISVQIFATDVSAKAIARARLGEYSKQQVRSVAPKRLQRFYSKSGNNYRIAKAVRDVCVFAPHNILRDPPFSRIDFVSCCNLLIYLESGAQAKIISTFHYALNPDGYLMLGKSEAIGRSDQFTQVNARFKIYSRKKDSSTRVLQNPIRRPLNIPNDKILPAKPLQKQIPAQNLDKAIDNILISRFTPACTVINQSMEILQFRGATTSYLRHPPGKASLHLLKMVPPEIAFELQLAIAKTVKTHQPVIKTDIPLTTKGDHRVITIEVVPIDLDGNERLLLVLFTEGNTTEIQLPGGKNHNKAAKDRKVDKLQNELISLRADIHLFTQDLEGINEQLQSANEEVVSSNEELQSVNEELETSKEEIESTNEELTSSNQELQTRNDLLNESYDYSEALINTVHEAMIVLDKDLRVKSANKSFYQTFRVTKAETEKTYLYDLGNKQWNIPRLRDLLEKIIPKNTEFNDFEVTHTFPDVGEKVMLLNARRIVQKTHGEKLMLLAFNDITDRTLLQRKEKELLEQVIREGKIYHLNLEKAVEERTVELQVANKELNLKNEQKEIKEAELIVANKKLVVKNQEVVKRIAERIKDEEYIGHLAAIVESTDDAIISKSLNGIIKSWNMGGEKMFGYTAKEAVGQPISLIIPPEYAEEERMILESVINNKTIEDFETIRVKKNGQKLHVSLTISPLKDRAGKIVGISKVARDITAKKKAEEELIKANKELLAQNSEKEKRAVELSLANRELAFQSEEKEKRAAELIVANRELVFQNSEKEKRAAELVVANTELVFQNGEKEKRAAELIIANRELGFQNEEKEKRAAELVVANAELIFQNGEKEKRAAELIIANKELGFQNEEKEKREAELIIANTELKAFSFVSSHDLQEPLRKIRSFSSRILENENLTEKGRDSFERMQKAATRMQQLIDDLLEFSRLSVAERNFETTNLNGIVEDVKTELRETIEEKFAIIESGQLGEANIVPFQFRQLMVNLLSNSLKFSSPERPPRIVIQSWIKPGNALDNEMLLPDKSYCRIQVSDNGIGFDSQYKSRIFEVFQRLHGKEDYPGTGIGLAIVKRVVDNHNGTITVASEIGKGTIFNIYLPVSA